MKVFIIGIAGGIGRRLARTLIARRDEVTGPVQRPEQVGQLAGQGALIGMLVGEWKQASAPQQ